MGERGKTEAPEASRKARPTRRRMTWAMLEMRRCRRNCMRGLGQLFFSFFSLSLSLFLPLPPASWFGYR